ncbi:hypothetical protein I5Q23_24575 [Serratia marcescens]|nr:hypothetical protein [Serratia marcescens]
MLLLDYIEMLYGHERGNKARFLQDNPTILPQELSRWLKAGLKIRPETGEIYKPVSRRVTVPEHAAVTAGIILSDELRERIGALAATQGLSAETLLRTWVDRDELRQQLTPSATLNAVPEQHIAGLVSRHLAPLSADSEVIDYRTALDSLLLALTDAELLSLTLRDVAESRRLAIPRTAYYWYGGVVAKGVSRMLGTLEVYLWHDFMRPESEVMFVGDARNVVASYFICQQLCRVLKSARTAFRKQQGHWASRRQEEEYAYEHIFRFAQGVMDTGIDMGNAQDDARLFDYACRHYAYAMD